MYVNRSVLAVVGAALLTLAVLLVRIGVDSGVDKATVSLGLSSTNNRTGTRIGNNGSLKSGLEDDEGGGEKNELNSKDAIEAEDDADPNSNCAYTLTAFDRTGKSQSQKSNSCLESDADLLARLASLSVAGVADPGATAVAAIGVVDRSNQQRLEALGLVADKFLAPRMEWRVMAERFDFEDGSESNGNSTGTGGTGIGGTEPDEWSLSRLFYDPAVHAPSESGTFADPFSAAVRTLLAATDGSKLPGDGDGATIASKNWRENEGPMGPDLAVDLILLRVFEEKLAAFAGALRRLQFPGIDVDIPADADSGGELGCAAGLERDQGRTFVRYCGPRDFLGALTKTSANWLATAIATGIPYVEVTPVQWARTYHFDTCSAETVAGIDPALGIVNGLDCGFLPIYGGTCLRDRVGPSLKCLSEFSMGLGPTHIALPRNGIPKEVCRASREQMPVGDGSPSAAGPPGAFLDWCPQCLVFGRKDNLTLPKFTPELVADPAVPMTFDEFKQGTGKLSLVDYMSMSTTRMKVRTCSMELLPLECGSDGRPCCWDEVSIEQNALGSADKISRPLYRNVLSSYLVRFNRSSRRRIARLHQPRLAAMYARGEGWEAALATGQCATLHIRRGDNMDRCRKNPGSKFCGMDLTLADYMGEAVPMLAALGGAQHVFVMTDDPEVAKEDRQEPWLEKGYKIHVISGYNQYSQQTYDDWDPFIESLYGAQFCRSFVGHLISTVSQLVFHSICTRWGECPIAEDFGDGPGVVW